MRLIKTGFNHSIIIKTVYLFISLFLFSFNLNSQCTGGAQIGTNQVPCSGSTTTINTVTFQNYFVIYVVSGINYRINSTRNGITLVNHATGVLIQHTTSNVINYTATFSGTMRIYNCNVNSTSNANISFTATNLASNDTDNQNNCGSNDWIGHIYKRLDATAGPPSDPNAFTSYIGYFKENESFTELFGGNTNCFQTFSNSNNWINTYTEFFAVRFCNQSVKPAGAYIISSVTADDGVRINVDGNLIMNRWIEQAPTTYNNILFNHTGNSQLKLEYYESAGQNTVGIGTMTRVNNVLNTNILQAYCQGGTNLQIGGTNTLTTAPVSSSAGYSVTYQWQISTNNVNFSNISGATAMNYTPTQTAPGTYYYRRIANVSTTNPGSIAVSAQDISNVAQLTIRPKPNGVLNGSVICEGDPTAQLTFTANAGTGPFSLIINGSTFNNITSGVPFSITAPATTTVYNLTKITDSYGCINP